MAQLYEELHGHRIWEMVPGRDGPHKDWADFCRSELQIAPAFLTALLNVAKLAPILEELHTKQAALEAAKEGLQEVNGRLERAALNILSPQGEHPASQPNGFGTKGQTDGKASETPKKVQKQAPAPKATKATGVKPSATPKPHGANFVSKNDPFFRLGPTQMKMARAIKEIGPCSLAAALKHVNGADPSDREIESAGGVMTSLKKRGILVLEGWAAHSKWKFNPSVSLPDEPRTSQLPLPTNGSSVSSVPV